MQSEKLEDGLRYAYDKFGVENTAIICRSNKACLAYNQLIRRNLLFRDEMIEVGDLLMIVKNNYFYKESPAGFLANGDFVEIMKVVNFEEMHDISYVRLVIRMLDYPDYEPFDALILLDSIYNNNLALPEDTEEKLLKAKKLEFNNSMEEIKKDQYMNALQVKFAYALTCHKSQGGQWDAVFVDQGFLKDDMVSNDYIRWLYTAITRSTKELYLVNFHQKFFE
jgi:exodeoxyribonuclease-5